jgi:hypothetical protein
MPVLDARALKKDPKGVAFLREVLSRNPSLAAGSETAIRNQPVARITKHSEIKIPTDLSRSA